MKWISGLSLLLLISPLAEGITPSSYRAAHPIGWAHMLPVGEAPGWGHSSWFHFELSHNNIWAAPIAYFNDRDQKSLGYHADFEQSSALIEWGQVLSESWALSIEIPYAQRESGVMDLLIDNFHVITGSFRFKRNDHPHNEREFSVQEEENERVSQGISNGVGNLKLKLKWWPLKWIGKNGNCDCGLSTSGQIKFPVGVREKGLTTGKVDYTWAWHLGFPLFDYSAIWITAAMTHTPENPLLKNWPRRKWHQMYELSMDFGITKSWGLLWQMRMESPLLFKHDMYIIDSGAPENEQEEEIASSGWNSLVEWRGTINLGLRYRPNKNWTTNLSMIEDLGWAVFEGNSDYTYFTNAPDVGFLLQVAHGF